MNDVKTTSQRALDGDTRPPALLLKSSEERTRKPTLAVLQQFSLSVKHNIYILKFDSSLNKSSLKVSFQPPRPPGPHMVYRTNLVFQV